MRDFLSYCGRVLRKAFDDGANWGRDQVVSLCIAIAILAVQIHMGIISVGQRGATLKSILWPYLALLAALVLLHLLRAPWKLDQAARREVSEERAARAKAQAELETALQDGPEVFLSYQSAGGYSGFIVQNRSGTKEACGVSIDSFETDRYRADRCDFFPSLQRQSIPQPFPMHMTDTVQNIDYVDLELGAMLRDSGNPMHCALTFVVRYTDSWGNRYKRTAKLSLDRLRLDINDLPEVQNGPIEWDRDGILASEAL